MQDTQQHRAIRRIACINTLLLLAALGALSAVAEPAFAAQCNSNYPVQLLTFSEYPLGTTITTQYQSLGVVVSGGGGSPFITTDGANPTSPVLSGVPLFAGSITATFVNPNDPTAPATAANVELDAGYFDTINSTAITYYDVNGSVLGSIQNSAYGIEHFVIPGNIHAFTIGEVGSEPAGFAIDNVSFQITPFSINSPKVGDMFPLTQGDFRETSPIAFEADDATNSGKVDWTVTMDYATSGGHGSFTTNDTFSSQLNQSTTRTYKYEGGRLTVNASETANSGGNTACPIDYSYVVGSAIPNAEITSRLESLYHGATPNLLTGIAMRESSYTQFYNSTLYGIAARWPHESASDGGSHIGLMQMPTTETHAWDWYANTSDAAQLFAEKIRTAKRLERRIRRQYKALPRLTDDQVENMALVLYGPYASPSLSMQYYDVQVVGNTATWIVNTANNPNGVSYADDIRQLGQ